MGCLLFEEDVEAAGIRNPREVNNAERDVVRVRRWSIGPRRKKIKNVGGLTSEKWNLPQVEQDWLEWVVYILERMMCWREDVTCGRFFLMTAAYGL